MRHIDELSAADVAALVGGLAALDHSPSSVLFDALAARAEELRASSARSSGRWWQRATPLWGTPPKRPAWSEAAGWPSNCSPPCHRMLPVGMLAPVHDCTQLLCCICCICTLPTWQHTSPFSVSSELFILPTNPTYSDQCFRCCLLSVFSAHFAECKLLRVLPSAHHSVYSTVACRRSHTSAVLVAPFPCSSTALPECYRTRMSVYSGGRRVFRTGSQKAGTHTPRQGRRKEEERKWEGYRVKIGSGHSKGARARCPCIYKWGPAWRCLPAALVLRWPQGQQLRCSGGPRPLCATPGGRLCRRRAAAECQP